MAEFRNPEQMSREEISQFFSSNKKNEICDALISMAFYDKDWKWSQDQCLHFLSHPDADVKGVAVSCLGHIARIHRQLDREVVEKALKEHLHDKIISDRVNDALEDIETYLA